MSKTNQAKSIIHPSFFLTVDTSYGTKDSTITIVPNCADKDCKRYVMHFNKSLEKFRNKGIKESKAAFDEFVQVLKNAAPVWHPDRQPEEVMFNTLRHISIYNDFSAVLFVKNEFDIKSATFPIKASQNTNVKQAEQVTAVIDYCDVIRPAYNPTLKIYNVDFTISIVLRNDEQKEAIYSTRYSFNGSMRIIRSNKASFTDLQGLEVDAPDTIIRSLGLRDVDIQSLIVRAIAAGGKYTNDARDCKEAIEVNTCAYGTLASAFEKCEAAFHAWLDTRDEKYNIPKAS